MKVRVYRNLDQPFSLFGVKGKFIVVFGVMAIMALAIATAIGFATSGFIGLGLSGIFLFLIYLVVTLTQNRFKEKDLERIVSSWGLPKSININTKPWK